MSSIPAQRSNVIYGDAALQTATITPTLTQAADGNSLKVTSDPEDLQMYQSLNLQDLFYDTRTSRDYPQSVSSNIIAFVGTTANWTLWSEVFLELEANITFQVVGTNASTGGVGTALNALPNIQNMTYYSPNNMLFTDFGYFNQPEFAFLQPIQRVEIKMGANNQVIGRYPMNYLPGILLNCKDKEYNNETKDIFTNFGLPTSRAIYASNATQGTVNVSVGSVANMYGYNTDYKDLLEAWNVKIKDIYKTACDNYAAAGGAFSTGSTATPTSLTQQIKFAIPLNFLNSVLDTQGYFPPGVPFRIEIQFNSSSFEIMNNYHKTVAEGITGGIGGDLTTASSYISPVAVTMQYTGLNSVLHRREHMLRQTAQEKINIDWIRKPFLYNYETYEYFDFPLTSGVAFYKQEIAISQQRPTQLFLVLINSTISGTTSIGTYTMKYPTATASNITNQILRHYPNASCPGFRISEMKVYISGRQNYYFRTEYTSAGFTTGAPVTSGTNTAILTGSGGYVKDATNALECLVNVHTYQDGFNTDLTKSKLWTFNEGGFFCCSINPGDCENKSFISSDQGASVVQLEFYITDAMNNQINTSGYILRCFKKLPEQMQLDAQKNITTISWPAAVADNRYIIPATYNLN